MKSAKTVSHMFEGYPKEQMKKDTAYKIKQSNNPEADKKINSLITFFMKEYSITRIEAIILIETRVKNLN